MSTSGATTNPAPPAPHARGCTALGVALGVGLMLFAGGCGALRPGPTGPLSLRGAHAPERRLPTDFDTRLYHFHDPDRVTIVLVQGPLDAPEQAMTLRLFWEPRPGRTTLVREATNTMVRYIRFTSGPDGERRAHVYSGAGFLWPSTSPGRATLRAGVREATLRLIDASDGHDDDDDALIETTLTGRFNATRDDAAAQRVLRELEAAVSEALSYPRFVRGEAPRRAEAR